MPHRHADTPPSLFTDIVGYTALMGSDEDRVFEILRKNREIHSKFIEQFNGTMIKEMGDGMLISFDLASDSVRCAIEIQKVCKSQEIPLNIASRIQDAAGAGCIMVSEAV